MTNLNPTKNGSNNRVVEIREKELSACIYIYSVLIIYILHDYTIFVRT